MNHIFSFWKNSDRIRLNGNVCDVWQYLLEGINYGSCYSSSSYRSFLKCTIWSWRIFLQPLPTATWTSLYRWALPQAWIIVMTVLHTRFRLYKSLVCQSCCTGVRQGPMSKNKSDGSKRSRLSASEESSGFPTGIKRQSTLYASWSPAWWVPRNLWSLPSSSRNWFGHATRRRSSRVTVKAVDTVANNKS